MIKTKEIYQTASSIQFETIVDIKHVNSKEAKKINIFKIPSYSIHPNKY
ncbi:hypothetical protein ACQVPY_15590 [Bacillus pretiosus]